jgi:hypothetical protein
MRHAILILFGLTALDGMVQGDACAQSLDQQVIGSSGRQFVTSSARVTFTIGEPLTATLAGEDGIITQGFHQGTITVTSVRQELPVAALSVHPNPTVDRLIVTTAAEGANWHLHTLDGKAVMHGTFKQGRNDIDVTALAQATYMLTVVAHNHRTNTYRIVKMQ